MVIVSTKEKQNMKELDKLINESHQLDMKNKEKKSQKWIDHFKYLVISVIRYVVYASLCQCIIWVTH